MQATAAQSKLVDALSHCAALGGPTSPALRLETHISYVLLTGRYAYKIKKAVDLGFLDFTTLSARQFFCSEELRLNRRLAPAVYIEVVPITGSLDNPTVGGAGPVLEYAVKMREFPQDALASRLLQRGELDAADIDALAAKVARFHGTIAVAAPDGAYGTPDGILDLARRNFGEIAPHLACESERGELERLRAWTEAEHAARRDIFLRRREQGFVRECHGDLHLSNIARIESELVIFDCIEFSASMRWIDVMNEIAFTVMDLADRGRADLAHRFQNAYLEATGDYAGLAVLPFYLAYRAMVRAKIARLRATQIDIGPERDAALAESRGYLRLARSYGASPRPALIITCGLSGCGKTTIAQALSETIGAVRIRSDVERKRMQGVGPLDRREGDIGEGWYAPAATESTYDRLHALARDIVSAGTTVIVDATFLRRSQRESFRALAARLGVAFLIVALEAKEATLRSRIARRQSGNADASDAHGGVLAHQIATREPLIADEKTPTFTYDAEGPIDAARTPGTWAELARRLFD
jgi:uncharacterized protein